MTPVHSDAARPSDADDWVLHMRWHDLLFAHWPLDPTVVQAVVPAPLVVDTFDGTAWVAVVPFRMSEVRLRRMPLPIANAFPELNVRTYVRLGSRTGVYFMSLDATSAVAVAAARSIAHLPYFAADITLDHAGPEVRYASRRTHAGAPEAEVRATYVPIGEPFESVPGTIDHWLTERHALMTVDRDGTAWQVRIDHVPWPLQQARAHFDVETATRAAGLSMPDRDPLLHFCRDLEVVALRPERISP
jgi:uncharacterized protein YqjF (DUF2071 family)